MPAIEEDKEITIVCKESELSERMMKVLEGLEAATRGSQAGIMIATAAFTALSSFLDNHTKGIK